MIIKKVTENSFILTSSITGNKIGLAIKKENGFSLVQVPNKIFNSLEEIAIHFGETYSDGTEKKKEVEELAVNEVNGFPIKHKEVFELASDTDTNLHTYKSKKNGKIIHVAGYFGVKFANGWVRSFCPKIETLLENEYIGPFKDKFALQFEITKHNREVK